MLTGLYSAASGMIIQERVQDVLAQNLANAQSPGSRREEVVVRSFPDVFLAATYEGMTPTTNKSRYNHAIGRVGTGAGVDWSYVDHTPGQMVHTGNTNDIALFGDGFFNVLTPDGIRFSRTSNFHVDREGYLVTSQGFSLLGQGVNSGRAPSRIQVGREDFSVDNHGQVTVRRFDQATQTTNEILIDQIRVSDFHEKERLFREPGNIFRAEEDDLDNFKVPENFRVAQGYIERSNSFPTTEMVKMIDSYRIHEASARVVKALDQTLGIAVREIAR